MRATVDGRERFRNMPGDMTYRHKNAPIAVRNDARAGLWIHYSANMSAPPEPSPPLLELEGLELTEPKKTIPPPARVLDLSLNYY